MWTTSISFGRDLRSGKEIFQDAWAVSSFVFLKQHWADIAADLKTNVHDRPNLLSQMSWHRIKHKFNSFTNSSLHVRLLWHLNDIKSKPIDWLPEAMPFLHPTSQWP
jgi:hypothetical protein